MAILKNKAFEQYYYAIYGERWPRLSESLLLSSKPVAYDHGLVKPYLLDYASVLTAAALRLPEPVSKEDGRNSILDACAAPGGKSLVIASRMGRNTFLTANEFSSERRRRLVSVIGEYLDEPVKERVRVTGFDAAKLGNRKKELKKFDAILLDVPCSSERHVYQDKKALSQWTPARPRFLSQRQWALLSAAFLILNEGGSLVYSTCAISTAENDDTVERLFGKYGEQVSLDEVDFAEGEKTKYGKIILPDQWDGLGPMYVARFRKNHSR